VTRRIIQWYMGFLSDAYAQECLNALNGNYANV